MTEDREKYLREMVTEANIRNAALHSSVMSDDSPLVTERLQEEFDDEMLEIFYFLKAEFEI